MLCIYPTLQPDKGPELQLSKDPAVLSIIIPTYNESKNILNLLVTLRKVMSHSISLTPEIIVVDDNSPDNTGGMVESYSENNLEQNAKESKADFYESRSDYFDSNPQTRECSIKVIHRSQKAGLVSAILEGIKSSTGQYILVMDADLSHSPEVIPKMVSELERPDIDIVVASRYALGSSIIGWPIKRRLLSKGAVKIARYGLPIRRVQDPMSGFFALKRHIIENITIDSAGYKILLEILVKASEARVKEIPYTFKDRKAGQSKLDKHVIFEYIAAVFSLYRYGQKSPRRETRQKGIEGRRSVLFLSKAGRFYTVGASGLVLNYMISVLLANNPAINSGYLQSTIVGIIVSNISNFLLNKFWTFEDRDFSLRRTLRQYALFAGISSGGAAIQLSSLYLFTKSGLSFEVSLITAVAIASVSNFLLNKKWTFGEKIWG
jgi:dolichol-phosphate mannosyltransferase